MDSRNNTGSAADGSTLKQLRAARRRERLQALQQGAAALVAGRLGWEVWLFGSWARGDWDSRSDVDLIAVAPAREEADQLADGLLSACLGDDVIALDATQWHDRRGSDDPHWRGITRDAIRLVPAEAAAPPAGRPPKQAPPQADSPQRRLT